MKTRIRKFAAIISISFIAFLVGTTTLCPIESWPQKMIVSVPIANVRDKQTPMKKSAYEKMDWEQVTQVLFGELVTAHERQGKWLRIKTPEQKICVNGKWYECCGWIRESHVTPMKTFPKYNLVVKTPWTFIYDLSYPQRKPILPVTLGTHLEGVHLNKDWCKVKLPNGRHGLIKEDTIYDLASWKRRRPTLLRKSILQTAAQFVGTPYLWGGRSFFTTQLNKTLSSSDCSGLTNLCYRIHGIEIPRNAYSQYMKSKKLSRNPRPGDLIFLSRKDNPKHIYHVLVYVGKNMLIEAKGDEVRKTRLISSNDRFGKSLKQIRNGEKVNSDFVYFGSFVQ
jgi:hypothetical protein